MASITANGRPSPTATRVVAGAGSPKHTIEVDSKQNGRGAEDWVKGSGATFTSATRTTTTRTPSTIANKTTKNNNPYTVSNKIQMPKNEKNENMRVTCAEGFGKVGAADSKN